MLLTQPVLALPVGPRDHVRGARDAPVTIVEYADAQCPYCGRLEPLLRDLVARRGDVRLVYRHYPLVDVHPSAYSAALAMEAAGAARDRAVEVVPDPLVPGCAR